MSVILSRKWGTLLRLLHVNDPLHCGCTSAPLLHGGWQMRNIMSQITLKKEKDYWQGEWSIDFSQLNPLYSRGGDFLSKCWNCEDVDYAKESAVWYHSDVQIICWGIYEIIKAFFSTQGDPAKGFKGDPFWRTQVVHVQLLPEVLSFEIVDISIVQMSKCFHVMFMDRKECQFPWNTGLTDLILSRLL